jgi:hypothetical protein
MDTREQLVFWPLVNQGQSIASDDWAVDRSTLEVNSTSADEITVINEWNAPADWQSTLDMVLFLGSPDWSKSALKPHSVLPNAPPASIAALAIAFAKRSNLSPHWLAADWPSANDRHAVARLVIRDIESGKTRARTRWLASSLKRISQEAVRHELGPVFSWGIPKSAIE